MSGRSANERVRVHVGRELCELAGVGWGLYVQGDRGAELGEIGGQVVDVAFDATIAVEVAQTTRANIATRIGGVMTRSLHGHSNCSTCLMTTLVSNNC
jgi:hypothetical protein